MNKFTIIDDLTRAKAVDFILTLSNEKTWEVTIKKKVKQRTLNQNSLYWQWVTIIGNHLGYFKDDMHEALKLMHLVPKVIIVNEVEFDVRSIKNLSTKEMSEYMDKVSLWANAEMGIFLPMPIDQQRNG